MAHPLRCACATRAPLRALRPRAVDAAQWKLDNPGRAVLGSDWGIIVREEPGGERMFTLVVNVSGGGRARTHAGASMWTPLLMCTCFPNAECFKALLHAAMGAERYYCGFVAHLPWAIMDGGRELIKAICEALNGCSVGETYRRIRESIQRGERPHEKITCPTRDKYHITASTKRWSATRMIVLPNTMDRNFYTRLNFKVVLALWNAGRPGARPGELKGKALTADESKEALAQADAHLLFTLHLAFSDTVPLVNGKVDLCAAATLRPLTSVDEFTDGDADAPASNNYYGLPAGEFEALTKTDAVPPPVVRPAVAPGEFYERCFRLEFQKYCELRIYLLKDRSAAGKLRWLMKAALSKAAPPEKVFVPGLNLSEVVETDADVLTRLDAGEEVELPNVFKNVSLYGYFRDFKFSHACVARVAARWVWVDALASQAGVLVSHPRPAEGPQPLQHLRRPHDHVQDAREAGGQAHLRGCPEDDGQQERPPRPRFPAPGAVCQRITVHVGRLSERTCCGGAAARRGKSESTVKSTTLWLAVRSMTDPAMASPGRRAAAAARPASCSPNGPRSGARRGLSSAALFGALVKPYLNSIFWAFFCRHAYGPSQAPRAPRCNAARSTGNASSASCASIESTSTQEMQDFVRRTRRTDRTNDAAFFDG